MPLDLDSTGIPDRPWPELTSDERTRLVAEWVGCIHWYGAEHGLDLVDALIVLDIGKAGNGRLPNVLFAMGVDDEVYAVREEHLIAVGILARQKQAA